MPFRKTILSLAVLLLATAPLALAQGTYTQIDVPGSIQTSCNGIDTSRDIVGWYEDSNRFYHGFLLSGGIYSTIDYPGAQLTSLYGINDSSQVVGNASGGFVYNIQTQTFSVVNYPGAAFTVATAINNAGTVAGYFATSNGPVQGFEFVGSTYKQIQSGPLNIYVYGISALGEVLGDADASRAVPFLFAHSKFRELQIPKAPACVALGINRTGTALVGWYRPSSGTIAGFSHQSGELQTLQFPGSNSTAATGVNDAGEVVGSFYDPSSNVHGFTWTPPADAAKK
jgi:probable HAF family extracellular repeat protein